jgi:glycerol uptake facilitator-like aquaporin
VTRLATCFYEADPDSALWRRAGTEALGTLLLTLAASAGGSAAQHAFSGAYNLTLPVLAFVVAATLVSLIVAFGKVSGGHFNPLITMIQWAFRERNSICTVSYVIAQCAGAVLGGLAGTVLWPSGNSTGTVDGWSGFGSEALASAGLMLIVFGCARSGKAESGPFAVGAWLMAAIIFTPTTSYANPAIVLGAVISGGPLHLPADAVAPFISAELFGGLLAFACIHIVYPAKKQFA